MNFLLKLNAIYRRKSMFPGKNLSRVKLSERKVIRRKKLEFGGRGSFRDPFQMIFFCSSLRFGLRFSFSFFFFLSGRSSDKLPDHQSIRGRRHAAVSRTWSDWRPLKRPGGALCQAKRQIDEIYCSVSLHFFFFDNKMFRCRPLSRRRVHVTTSCQSPWHYCPVCKLTPPPSPWLCAIHIYCRHHLQFYHDTIWLLADFIAFHLRSRGLASHQSASHTPERFTREENWP